MSLLACCVALGLCEETQDSEVAVEQLTVNVRALETRVLEAEAEARRVQAEESARLDAKLLDVRRRYPFLSLERCAALLEFEEAY